MKSKIAYTPKYVQQAKFRTACKGPMWINARQRFARMYLHVKIVNKLTAYKWSFFQNYIYLFFDILIW